MPEILGRILQKEVIEKRANIIIEDSSSGDVFSIQVRPKSKDKIQCIETNDFVKIFYKNEVSEVQRKAGIERINNLILTEIEKIR